MGCGLQLTSCSEATLPALRARRGDQDKQAPSRAGSGPCQCSSPERPGRRARCPLSPTPTAAPEPRAIAAPHSCRVGTCLLCCLKKVPRPRSPWALVSPGTAGAACRSPTWAQQVPLHLRRPHAQPARGRPFVQGQLAARGDLGVPPGCRPGVQWGSSSAPPAPDPATAGLVSWPPALLSASPWLPGQLAVSCCLLIHVALSQFNTNRFHTKVRETTLTFSQENPFVSGFCSGSEFSPEMSGG